MSEQKIKVAYNLEAVVFSNKMHNLIRTMAENGFEDYINTIDENDDGISVFSYIEFQLKDTLIDYHRGIIIPKLLENDEDLNKMNLLLGIVHEIAGKDIESFIVKRED